MTPRIDLHIGHPPVIRILAGQSAAHRPGHFELERDGRRISTDPALLDIDLVHGWLSRESYWAAGIPRAVVVDAIAHSLCFGLYGGDNRQLGFARVVTDRATFAYLCDVFVLGSERGQGLGKWLVEAVQSHPALAGVRRFMLATRDAHALYASCGFSPLGAPEKFMEINRPDIYRAAAA